MKTVPEENPTEPAVAGEILTARAECQALRAENGFDEPLLEFKPGKSGKTWFAEGPRGAQYILESGGRFGNLSRSPNHEWLPWTSYGAKDSLEDALSSAQMGYDYGSPILEPEVVRLRAMFRTVVSPENLGEMLETLDCGPLRELLGYIEDHGSESMWDKAKSFMAYRDAVIAKAEGGAYE